MSTRVSSRARVRLATPWALAVHPTAAASRGTTSHSSRRGRIDVADSPRSAAHLASSAAAVMPIASVMARAWTSRTPERGLGRRACCSPDWENLTGRWRRCWPQRPAPPRARCLGPGCHRRTQWRLGPSRRPTVAGSRPAPNGRTRDRHRPPAAPLGCPPGVLPDSSVHTAATWRAALACADRRALDGGCLSYRPDAGAQMGTRRRSAAARPRCQRPRPQSGQSSPPLSPSRPPAGRCDFSLPAIQWREAQGLRTRLPCLGQQGFYIQWFAHGSPLGMWRCSEMIKPQRAPKKRRAAYWYSPRTTHAAACLSSLDSVDSVLALPLSRHEYDQRRTEGMPGSGS